MTARITAVVLCLLGAAAAVPGRATPAPPQPPCVPASPSVTTAALAATLAGHGTGGNYRLHECAADDLVARGAAAVPAVVGFLGGSDLYTRDLALRVLTRLGPKAHAALPALMDQIGGRPPNWFNMGHRRLYGAVAALGPAARPAIPLLITQSHDLEYRYAALHALGKLGQYDPEHVVPYLVSVLERRPEEHDVPAALDALAEIGKPARAALPAILAEIERAKAGIGPSGSEELSALAAIGEAGESIPALVGLLDHPVLAGSAARALAGAGPLPPEFVPALAAALARNPEDFWLARALSNAQAVD